MTDSATLGMREEQTDLLALTERIAENGVLAGMLGATVVAIWYLLVDTIGRGTPLYTPSLLGSIAFGGLDPSQVTGVNGAAVFAYTGLHGVLFLLAGGLLAWMFSQFERNPQVGLILLLLFLMFEAILWGVGVSIIPALAGVVGAWTILVANLASAAVMFGFLLRRHPHTWARLQEAWSE